MAISLSSAELDEAKAKVLEAGTAVQALQQLAVDQNGSWTDGPLLRASHALSDAYEALEQAAVYSAS